MSKQLFKVQVVFHDILMVEVSFKYFLALIVSKILENNIFLEYTDRCIPNPEANNAQ